MRSFRFFVPLLEFHVLASVALAPVGAGSACRHPTHPIPTRENQCFLDTHIPWNPEYSIS